MALTVGEYRGSKIHIVRDFLVQQIFEKFSQTLCFCILVDSSMACRAVDEIQLWTINFGLLEMLTGTYHRPGNHLFFVENTVIVNEMIDFISKPGKHPYW